MNRLVKIRWTDATHIEDDVAESKLANLKPVEFTTVGTVIVDDGKTFILAGTVCYDEEKTLMVSGTVCKEEGEYVYRDSLILPRQYIIEVRELQEVLSDPKQ